MSIKKLAIMTLLSMSSFAAFEAGAVCSISSKVERVYQNATTTYIYLLPSIASLNSSYYYYFITTDPDLAQAAHESLGTNTYVNVVGNATSCPTTGTGRYGGVITTVSRY